MLGQSGMAFDVEIYITAIAERTGQLVGKIMYVAGTVGRDEMVVPLIGFHREEDIEARVRQKPIVHFGFWILDFGLVDGPGLRVPNGGQTNSGVGDDAAAGFEKES